MLAPSWCCNFVVYFHKVSDRREGGMERVTYGHMVRQKDAEGEEIEYV